MHHIMLIMSLFDRGNVSQLNYMEAVLTLTLIDCHKMLFYRTKITYVCVEICIGQE